jgi:hypothetical protein
LVGVLEELLLVFTLLFAGDVAFDDGLGFDAVLAAAEADAAVFVIILSVYVHGLYAFRFTI